ncbi:hypothetical protein EOM39_03625 [Candidatus Gracilibacteria bacterium]|nr:hypothetical protein [Candidatus Gracilibacteria bacterium]
MSEILNIENVNTLNKKLLEKPELSFASSIIGELKSIKINDENTIIVLNTLVNTANSEKDDKSFNETLGKIISEINILKSSINSLEHGTRKQLESFEKDNVKNLLIYFGIEKNKTQEIQDRFIELGLDLFPMLANFRLYIDKDLSRLDPKLRNKIIKSIQIKLSNITNKLDELKDEELSRFGNLVKFKDNRWIVNDMVKNLFEKTTNQVLPGALLLAKKIDINKLDQTDKDKYNRLLEMFNSELTSDGDFDKKFFSSEGIGEVLDFYSNNWETFDSEKGEDLKLLQENSFDKNKLSEINLLNNEDKEIEDNATMGYFAGIAALIGNDIATFSGIWSIPGATIGIGYSAIDAFTKDDFLVTILKSINVIPEQFRTNKEWYDNAIAGIGIIPGVKTISKSPKLATYISKLKGVDLTRFNNMVTTISDKLKNIDLEKYTKIFKIKNKNIISEISKEADELKRGRSTPGNKGLPSGSYSSYNDRYTKLYAELDAKGIVDPVRGTEIEKLDNLIAKEIVDLRLVNKGNISSVLPKLKSLKDGETIKVGDFEFTKNGGKYNFIFNGDTYSYNFAQVKDLLRYQGKRLKLINKYQGVSKTIKGNQVEINKKGEILVTNTSGKVIKGDELKKFIEDNSSEIFKKFNGVSLEQFIINYKKTILQKLRQNGISTIGDYISKAGYSVRDGNKKSRVYGSGLDGDGLKEKADYIGGVALTPLTTIKQVLDAVSDKDWGELVKIMFFGNKNSSYVGGLLNQAMIGGTVFYADNKTQDIIGMDSSFNPLKNINIDKDQTAGDELMDYALYTYGGIFYTLIGKGFRLID